MTVKSSLIGTWTRVSSTQSRTCFEAASSSSGNKYLYCVFGAEDVMLAGGTQGGMVPAVADCEPVDLDGPADWDDDVDGFGVC